MRFVRTLASTLRLESHTKRRRISMDQELARLSDDPSQRAPGPHRHTCTLTFQGSPFSRAGRGPGEAEQKVNDGSWRAACCRSVIVEPRRRSLSRSVRAPELPTSSRRWPACSSVTWRGSNEPAARRARDGARQRALRLFALPGGAPHGAHMASRASISRGALESAELAVGYAQSGDLVGLQASLGASYARGAVSGAQLGGAVSAGAVAGHRAPYSQPQGVDASRRVVQLEPAAPQRCAVSLRRALRDADVGV
jgi:hypothetical protein